MQDHHQALSGGGIQEDDFEFANEYFTFINNKLKLQIFIYLVSSKSNVRSLSTVVSWMMNPFLSPL